MGVVYSPVIQKFNFKTDTVHIILLANVYGVHLQQKLKRRAANIATSTRVVNLRQELFAKWCCRSCLSCCSIVWTMSEQLFWLAVSFTAITVRRLNDLFLSDPNEFASRLLWLKILSACIKLTIGLLLQLFDSVIAMENSSFNTLLIKAVKGRRCLYDKMHDDYKDTKIKQKNWSEIADNLDCEREYDYR